ncbi:hypothetical protein MIR68_009716 [Amoeboaphelidium protococcarum]|nr:hypothetical protein MIR68_009716 [Amoeboaphelidium protococcarum]
MITTTQFALIGIGSLSISLSLYVLLSIDYGQKRKELDQQQPPLTPLQMVHLMSPAMKSPNSEALIQLLNSVSETQAQIDAHIHRGVTCNECHQSAIRGIRFKCLNCMDFDICQQCQFTTTHNPLHCFVQIKIPIPPLANPRIALLRPFYNGNMNQSYTDPVDSDDMDSVRAETAFDPLQFGALYQQFLSQAVSVQQNNDGTVIAVITKDNFTRCFGPIGNGNKYLIDRLFQVFSSLNDKEIISAGITFGGFIRCMNILINGTKELKIEFAFKVIDSGFKGAIVQEDLKRFLIAYLDLSKEFVRDVVRSVGEETLDNFNMRGVGSGNLIKNTAPVSASFTAPIPVVKLPPLSPGSQSMWNNSERDRLRLLQLASEQSIDSLAGSLVQSIKLDNATINDASITLNDFLEFSKSDERFVSWLDLIGTIF